MCVLSQRERKKERERERQRETEKIVACVCVSGSGSKKDMCTAISFLIICLTNINESCSSEGMIDSQLPPPQQQQDEQQGR